MIKSEVNEMKPKIFPKMKRSSTIRSMPSPPSIGSQKPDQNQQTVPAIPIKAKAPKKPFLDKKFIWTSSTKYSGKNIDEEIIFIK